MHDDKPRSRIAADKIVRRLKPLTVICTNIPESSETLLRNQRQHDADEWLKLCNNMSLPPISPLSLIRLRRHPSSPHNGKPRMLQVMLSKEEELEEVLLSAHLLKNNGNGLSRVFADVPFWERAARKNQREKATNDDRSVILLGVPEAKEDPEPAKDSNHDVQQWKYLAELTKVQGVVATNTFRIPKSPRYLGSGPRPLKITFLNPEMADKFKRLWQAGRHIVPRETRLCTGKTKPPILQDLNDATPTTSPPKALHNKSKNVTASNQSESAN